MRLILLAAAATLVAGPALAADGAAVFNTQCKACHTLADKGGPAGPSLKGVVGRKVAGTDFNYSPALKAKGGSWNEAGLDAYLTNPSAFAPGGKMFTRVGDPDSRAALIAFLKTLK